MKIKLTRLIGALAVLALSTLNSPLSTLHAQGTAFTYQGRLNVGGIPANGLYDYRFKLYADPLGNTQVGGSYLTNAIAVTSGLFITTIDFGAAIFTGSNYWLEVDVKTNLAGGYTVLIPLQSVTPTPYAVFANTASNVSGTVSAAQINGAMASANLSGTYGNAVTLNNGANQIAGSFTGNGASVANVNAAALNGLNATNFWQLGGNSVAPGQFLGSTNNQPVELWVNNGRALRLESGSTGNGAPNVIGGSPTNYVSSGVLGATIGGGGATNWGGFSYPNSVAADFGTVGGGQENAVSGSAATIGGGYLNTANGAEATIGGGQQNNANGNFPTVGGGAENSASGNFATVGGGGYNSALNYNSTVPGGYANTASGANSFAAGLDAQALHDGAFVWADNSLYAPFSSTATNQFLIRAQGGVGINMNNPNGASLYVQGDRTNNWPNSMSFFENTELGTNASPALRVVSDAANTPAGALSVSVQGSGLIAQFGNGGGFVSQLDANGNWTANSFTGGGGGLTGLNAASLTGAVPSSSLTSVPAASLTGTVPLAQLPGVVITNNETGVTLSGTFNGNGTGLTSLNANNLSSGTVPLGQLSGITSTQLNAATWQLATNLNGGYSALASNVVSGIAITNAFITNSVFAGNGGGLTNLNAAQLSSGVIPSSVLPGFQSPNFAVISGGIQNTSSAGYSVVAGGNGNNASALDATVSGGNGNTANNSYATVVGGQGNIASGLYSTAIGWGANASGKAATAIGSFLNASGSYSVALNNNTLASGTAATAMGQSSVASGNESLAAGNQAQATNNGAFVWADSQNAPFISTNNDSFNVRAQGGVRLVTSGAGLTVDGNPVLTSGSSALGFAIKQNPGSTNGAPNLIGGSSANGVAAGVIGAVIAGGGATNLNGSTVFSNSIASDFSSIGGGIGNFIDTNSVESVIAGGFQNVIQGRDTYDVIGGGSANNIGFNTYESVIGGGYGNNIGLNSYWSYIGGGRANSIGTNSQMSLIGGGYFNSIKNYAGENIIVGGYGNIIDSNAGANFIGGGESILIQSNAIYSVIGGGDYNTIRTNAQYAAIVGGLYNIAGGNFSFAAGQQAQALHQGAFVWADSQSSAFASTANDQFLIRAQGGVGINNNNPGGASLSVSGPTVFSPGSGTLTITNDGGIVPGFVASGGGATGHARFRNALEIWPNTALTSSGFLDVRNTAGTATISLNGQSGLATCVTLSQTSDRNAKEHFQPVSVQEVLAKVAALPVSRWNYKQDSASEHIGPMAQDFYAAFNVGPDDRHITTVDEGGVALAAIQEAETQMEKLQAENAELKQQLNELKVLVNQLARQK